MKSEQLRTKICEDHYEEGAEPWNYSVRSMELLRHEWIAENLKKTGIQSDTRVLEMGCSLGLMTEKIAELGPKITAIDLSPKAIAQAKVRCRQFNNVEFQVADVCKLPFPDSSFDRVTVCDGLFSWYLSEEAQAQVSMEVSRVLKPGGIALFSDYIHHKAFYKVRANAVVGGLTILEEHLLGDHPGYQFASAFKAIEDWKPVEKILANRRLGKMLLWLGKRFGESGSRHILVIAKKAALSS